MSTRSMGVNHTMAMDYFRFKHFLVVGSLKSIFSKMSYISAKKIHEFANWLGWVNLFTALLFNGT